IRIHDNTVIAPFGPALAVTALGGVSVVANHFRSQASLTFSKASLFSGTTVSILNLGLPYEIPAQALYFTILAAALKQSQNLSLAVQQFRSYGGAILFAANQCAFTAEGAQRTQATSAIAIATLDDVAFENNQCEVHPGTSTVHAGANAFVLGSTIRVI